MIKQAVGGIFTGILAVACGWMGERHHIGFPVASRFSWGMRGSYCRFNSITPCEYAFRTHEWQKFLLFFDVFLVASGLECSHTGKVYFKSIRQPPRLILII